MVWMWCMGAEDGWPSEAGRDAGVELLPGPSSDDGGMGCLEGEGKAAGEGEVCLGLDKAAHGGLRGEGEANSL